ncbi:MAG: LacI family DNA-binding transcriptional regulator [Christensenellaceae bacterium]|nr:LacI family DNA-binding transcriptional regulator [Christensenellaceae bacterium]
MTKNTTLKDIAEASGVSITTVRKALNNQGKISEELRQKIIKIADDMNYTPNKLAQAMARDSLKIGVLIPSHPATFFDYIEEGAKKAFLELKNYNVEGIIRRTNSVEESKNIWKGFFESDIAGVFSCFVGDVNPGCREIQERYPDKKMPIVAAVHPPIDDTETIGNIYVQGRTTGAIAAQFLSKILPKGSKTVVCVPDDITSNHVESVEVFKEECLRGGLDFQKQYIMQFRSDKEWETAEQILKDFPDIRGIYVGSNNAYLLCKFFESKGMIEDVQIIGHDLYPGLAECIEKGSLVATLFQNQCENAYRGIIGLSDYISGYEVGFDSLRHRPEFVMRANLHAYEGLY